MAPSLPLVILKLAICGDVYCLMECNLKFNRYLEKSIVILKILLLSGVAWLDVYKFVFKFNPVFVFQFSRLCFVCACVAIVL